MALMTAHKLSPEGTSGNETLKALDDRIVRVIEEFTASPIWMTLSDPTTPVELIRAIIREVYWEIHCYQPYTTKAGFTMIGRTEPDERKVMRTLLLHKWEEVEHRAWALDGYKALGGDLTRIGREDVFLSPGAFAVSAVWERLSEALHPLAYMGAEYLFEDLTAHLTKMVVESLRTRELSADGMRFILDHATEDEKHSNLLKALITDVTTRRPDLHSQIVFAFDCFHQVYPIPLWIESFGRACEAKSF